MKPWLVTSSPIYSALVVLDRLRASLMGRGVKTIRGLGKVFKAMDSMDGNRKLDKEEFHWGLKEIGCELSKRESEVLLKFMDTDGDDQINYDDEPRSQLL